MEILHVEQLNKQAWDVRYDDTRLAHKLSQQAHTMALQNEDTHQNALSLRTLSFCCASNGAYDEALQYGTKSAELLEQLNDAANLADTTRILGRIHWDLGDYSTSLEFGLRTLELARQSGNQQLEAHTYNNTAMTYARLGEFNQVGEMLQNALKSFRAVEDERGVVLAYNNLAMLHSNNNDFQSALHAANNGWEIALGNGMSDLQAIVLDTLGQIHTELEQYEEALEKLSTARQIAKDNDMAKEAINADLNIARIFQQQSQNDKAIERGLHLLSVSEILNSKQILLECHELLADCYENVGDFQSALVHHRKFHNIHNTVFAEERDRRFANLEVTFRTNAAKKEAEIFRNKNDELEHEIAERIRVEEQLTIAKEMAEEATRFKSGFLANMSHEIRTPMNGVIGMTHLLMETALSHEQQEYVQTVRSSGDALLTIINDILDFSKIEAGKLEIEQVPFNLVNCIEDTLDLLAPKAHEKGLELFYDFASYIPSQLLGDVTRLRQILLNLLSNAIKFTHEGDVQLYVSLVDSPALNRHGHLSDEELADSQYADSLPTEQMLQFVVQDTGIGISKEGLDCLFQSYAQAESSTARKYGGTGLGLVISRQLCELMGGEMWVESKVGRGSQFYFTISAAMPLEHPPEQLTEHSAEPPARHQEPSKELAQRNVLIVEDHGGYGALLEKLATDWNMVPRLVTSGAQAISSLSKTDDGWVPDILWLDHTLPDMEGVALLRRLRASSLHQEIPIICLLQRSSQEMQELREEFPRATAIYKPVKPNELHHRATELLGHEVTHRHPPNQSLLMENASLADGHPLRILLVEDNPVNQKVATAILGRLGYDSDLAENGLEAVAMATLKPYDLILMDVHLPEMDGYEATIKIRQTSATWQPPTIVALTASALSEERQRCLDVGMDAFLSKPIQVNELVEILKSASAALALSAA